MGLVQPRVMMVRQVKIVFFDSTDSSDEELVFDSLVAHETATKQMRAQYPRNHRIREPWSTRANGFFVLHVSCRAANIMVHTAIES